MALYHVTMLIGGCWLAVLLAIFSLVTVAVGLLLRYIMCMLVSEARCRLSQASVLY